MNARKLLLADRNSAGFWEGELSSSALSTATAIVALSLVNKETYAPQIEAGVSWLLASQNADGGWGDTPKSFSNVSTTLLCWAALSAADVPDNTPAVRIAESWIRDYCGSKNPGKIAKAVTARYGRDRTFSVPILMTLCLCGKLGESEEAWKRVLALPFELAAFPRELFSTLRFPVVSYALPALIAIGQARFHHAPPGFLPLRWLRLQTKEKTSQLLKSLQPSSGGFLEATPLTSFVVMALAGANMKDHPVIPQAVEFLLKSLRKDGSWPIDTNLATWGTTLSIKALHSGGSHCQDFPKSERDTIYRWIKKQQYKEVHPFTDAEPGGWAWTDLPGGVPDADDTAGALLSLLILHPKPQPCDVFSARQGVIWLLNLQNHNGGMPTFCKGWGTLPFDRSSPDLTAHAMRAWKAWYPHMTENIQARIDTALSSSLEYLRRNQNDDGSWTPLWFGNQHETKDRNPTYGTSMVLKALTDVASDPHSRSMKTSAIAWLRTHQNPDGGWGGGQVPSSIEETAIALDALANAGLNDKACLNGAVRWLITKTEGGTQFDAAPIGFYFAKLWYHEKLYPIAWTIGALESFRSAKSNSKA